MIFVQNTQEFEFLTCCTNLLGNDLYGLQKKLCWVDELHVCFLQTIAKKEKAQQILVEQAQKKIQN